MSAAAGAVQQPVKLDLVAHPVTETVSLGVPPALVATVVGLAVLGIARLAQRTSTASATSATTPPGTAPHADSLEPTVTLSGAHLAWRALGLALLLLAIVAGRIGSPDQCSRRLRCC
ncbi:MAG: hypothetical protein ACR2HR_02090 [Euzebya sp.]